ncbi:hypothetical protein ABW21_db0206762 [Orbilia brochopaga]|nr:hypothetical protein ABW21_db0206762 [Drechslerella brochopaga]
MYRNGSLLFASHSKQQRENMSVPTLQHLGIKFADISDYCFRPGGRKEPCGPGLQPPGGPSFSQSQGLAAGGDNRDPVFANGDKDTGELRNKRPRMARRWQSTAMRQAATDAQGLLLLTAHDRAKATAMLQRGETEYAADLRNMLVVGYKAEIEILGDQLVRYLEEKLASQHIGLAA